MGKGVEIKIGWTAPPLQGTLVSGERFKLVELRPREVLVEFHRGTW